VDARRAADEELGRAAQPELLHLLGAERGHADSDAHTGSSVTAAMLASFSGHSSSCQWFQSSGKPCTATASTWASAGEVHEVHAQVPQAAAARETTVVEPRRLRPAGVVEHGLDGVHAAERTAAHLVADPLHASSETRRPSYAATRADPAREVFRVTADVASRLPRGTSGPPRARTSGSDRSRTRRSAKRPPDQQEGKVLAPIVQRRRPGAVLPGLSSVYWRGLTHAALPVRSAPPLFVELSPRAWQSGHRPARRVGPAAGVDLACLADGGAW
jgi:hypothetical protein